MSDILTLQKGDCGLYGFKPKPMETLFFAPVKSIPILPKYRIFYEIQGDDRSAGTNSHLCCEALEVGIDH